MSKKRIWAGRIPTALVTIALTGSAIAKIAGVPRAIEGLTRAGIPHEAIIVIAALELACLALYLIPRTKILGTLLLTGYLGGAIVTHIIGRQTLAPPIVVGVWTWAGALLNVPAFANLVPFRRNEASAAIPLQPAGSVVWIHRVVLAAAGLIFTMIGLRYIADPVHAAAATGATLGSALAATTARVGLGAFPLSFAIFSFVCLLSKRYLAAGVRLVMTVMATAIVVRLFSMSADGAIPESTRLFAPEAVILALCAGGLLLESARAKPPSSIARESLGD